MNDVEANSEQFILMPLYSNNKVLCLKLLAPCSQLMIMHTIDKEYIIDDTQYASLTVSIPLFYLDHSNLTEYHRNESPAIHNQTY